MKAYIFYKQFLDSIGENRVIGGIETYLLNLTEVLFEKGIETVIVQSSAIDFRRKVNGIIVRGIPVGGDRNIYRSLYLKVQGSITDKDLIIWGLDRGAIKIPHKRTISIQHGIPFDYYQEEIGIRNLLKKYGLGHFFKFIQRKKAIQAFKNSSIRVCVDYNFWNWYRTFCLPEEEKNIYIIPNFARIDQQEDFWTSKQNEVINILFARRFVRMRGIEDFMNVAKYYKNDKRVTITFAGEGPYEERIVALIQNSNNLFITKYQSEKAVDFHRNYDIAVIPSIASEGTSLSLLEAMAAGNVVICTCVGGMTNIVLDGFNGFFVMPNSSQKIIQIIENLLVNAELRERIAKNAMNSVRYSFSFEIWKKKWSDVIDDVCMLQ